MSQKEEKEEFEPKSLTKLPTVEMQVLRDNNINISSFFRDCLKIKADELRSKK